MSLQGIPAAPRPQTAEGRYEQLKPFREPFLQRARDGAMLTIPGLIPPEGSSGTTKFYKPFQSVGADGVNNLAAKLLLVLFPPGGSFFRLTMDDFLVEKLKQAAGGGQGGEDARAAFEEALGKMERAVTNRTEQTGARTVHYEAIQHLIVGGNGLLYVDPGARTRFFPLSNYVVKRDQSGNVLEIVIEESLAPSTLPEKASEIYARNKTDKDEGGAEKTVKLFTWVKRKKGGSFSVHQEVCGEIIPGTEGTYPAGKNAYLALRWRIVPNEDYGRGRVEEYSGDLSSLEGLSQALLDIAAQASKIVWLVDESGTTSKEDIAKAESGAVLDGNAKDVTVLQLEKLNDFQVTLARATALEQRLERAFLLSSSVQRNAERVTAEEIRAMVGELEQSLGGVYSILSEEYQRPYVVRVMHQMTVRGELPKLPGKAVSPQIVTGLEGLGRITDLQRLDAFLSGIGQQFGPEALAERINVGAYMKRRGAALGLDLDGLIRTEEEIQAARQQDQLSQTVQKLGPAGIKAMSDQALAAKEQPAAA